MRSPEPTAEDAAHRIAAYLPRVQLAGFAARGGAPDEPTAFSSRAAVLFVDVVGFSRVTARHSEQGQRGAELLSQVLNRNFGQLTETIEAWGGDVLLFAGDAVFAQWSERHWGADALTLATECGLAVQRAFADSGDEDRFSLRVAIGWGQQQIAEVGGHGGAWFVLPTGAALDQVRVGGKLAEPGMVVVSREAWTDLGPGYDGEGVGDGVMAVTGGGLAEAPGFVARPDVSAVTAALSACLPPAVAESALGGDVAWLAEFRTITALFVRLVAADAPNADADVRTLHSAVAATQAVLARFGGFAYEVVGDDKGVIFVAVFGVPPFAHENDADRAVRSALDIQVELEALGLIPAMGMATGRTYAGVIGSDRRHHYGLVGPVLTLAARLMESTGSGIAVDESVARSLSAGTARLGPPRELELKGFPQGVRAFTVAPPIESSALPTEPRQSTMVGRVEERRRLAASLDRLVETGEGGCMVLVGEPGIGKSHLIRDLTESATARGVRVLAGLADDIEAGVGYYPWQGAFRALLELDPGAPEAETRERVGDRLRSLPGRAEAALLNDVLGTDFEWSASAADLSDELRARARTQLLADLLAQMAGDTPLLVTLEDLHWFDSSSQKLVIRLIQQVPELLIVATARPGGTDFLEEDPAVWARLDVMEVGRLSEAESGALLARRLGTDDVPRSVASLVHRKAAGNPLFAEEIGLALVDYGVVAITGDRCELIDPDADPERVLAEAMSRVGAPLTIQALISSRLGRLPHREQVTLKLASVIGRSFSRAALEATYPESIARASIGDSLADLEGRGLIQRSPEDAFTFEFHHALTRDVTYETLVFSQRKQLHGAVAAWYETGLDSETRPAPSVLAYHWREADVMPKARAYLRAAGDQALAQHANHEASAFFSEALDIDAELPAPESLPDEERAFVLLGLGKSLVGLSRYGLARVPLEEAVGALGVPVAGAKGLAVSIGGQLLRQARIRYRRSVPTSPPGTRETTLELSSAYEALAEIYHWQEEQGRSFDACLRSLNLAERVGSSPQLARGYASVGTALAYSGIYGTSRRYAERARATVLGLGQRSAVPYVNVIVGIGRAGLGDWDWAVELLEEAVEVSEDLGDVRQWANATHNLVLIDVLRNGENADARRSEELLARSIEANDVRFQMGALRALGYVRLDRGELESLEELLERARHTLSQGRLQGDVEGSLRDYHALRAKLLSERGELTEALESAREASKHIVDALPTVDMCYGHLSASLASSVGRDAHMAGLADCEEMVRKLAAKLKQRTRLFPIAKPALARARGNLAMVRGRSEAARGEWEQSLAVATEMGLGRDVRIANRLLQRRSADA